MGKACHASAGVPTELIEVAIAVSGWVDSADSDVVFNYLEHYFMGSQWGYWQPEGYDTYDAVDVMIMSFGVLSETQAAKLIAASGNAKEGRIPFDALTQHAIDRFATNQGYLPPEAPAARAQVSLPGSKVAEEAIRAAAHPLPD